MFLNEIEKNLDELRKECVQLLFGIEALQNRIRNEISHRNNVELSLVLPKRRRAKGAINQKGAKTEYFRPFRVNDYPVLYDRMKECGFSLSGIKALFGDKTRIMSKISYGNERFTDYEAEKLTELFQLTEEEQRKYFWRGIIQTGKHPVD